MSPQTSAAIRLHGPNAESVSATLGRRSLLRRALAGVTTLAVGAPLCGCADTPMPRMAEGSGPSPTITATGSAEVTVTSTLVDRAVGSTTGTATASVDLAGSPAAATPIPGKVLLAYFSRAGENYSYGGRTRLAVGNTAVLAGMIARLIGCDIYRIEAATPYPDDYEATVARNVREQDADARPALASPPPALAGYDTVLLGSPIWNVRPPLIMATFAGHLDFTGKAVHPFVTYAVSGLGTAARDYATWCPGATVGEGLAVRGEEVGAGGAAVEAWLRRVGLLAD